MPDIILIPNTKLDVVIGFSKLPTDLENTLSDVITSQLYYKPLQQRILGIYRVVYELNVVLEQRIYST